jgi:hypothetical protein
MPHLCLPLECDALRAKGKVWTRVDYKAAWSCEGCQRDPLHHLHQPMPPREPLPNLLCFTYRPCDSLTCPLFLAPKLSKNVPLPLFRPHLQPFISKAHTRYAPCRAGGFILYESNLFFFFLGGAFKSRRPRGFPVTRYHLKALRCIVLDTASTAGRDR